jgi:hypothetical protein
VIATSLGLQAAVFPALAPKSSEIIGFVPEESRKANVKSRKAHLAQGLRSA